MHLRSLLALFCLIASIFLSACYKIPYSAKQAAAKGSTGDCVVLLHGMGRTYQSMDNLQKVLTDRGYHTVNIGYPSTKKNIETLAQEHFPMAIEQCKKFNPKRIHFVSHSLGGIIIRQAIKNDRPAQLGRVVMLSPPNKGASVVDAIGDWKIYKWLNGPAGQQLSTHPSSLPNRLGPVDYPVGVISGNRYAWFDGWLSNIIPGLDDGKVSVERTKLEGMSDFLVVSESHPFIMNSAYVQEETIHFLKYGKFNHQHFQPPPVSGIDWYSSPND